MSLLVEYVSERSCAHHRGQFTVLIVNDTVLAVSVVVVISASQE